MDMEIIHTKKRQEILDKTVKSLRHVMYYG